MTTVVQPRKILLQAMMLRPQAGLNEIRVLHPNAFLSTIPGVRTLAVSAKFDVKSGSGDEEKIAIIQRLYLKVSDIRQLLNHNYLIVYELDDDPFSAKTQSDDNFLYLRANHGLQTSTDQLAEIIEPYSSEISVFKNQLVVLPPVRPPRPYHPVSIFFGAINRENEHPALMPIINKIAKELDGGVRFIVVHDQAYFNSLQTEHKRFHPHCDYNTYLQILRDADIALLPLSDTLFNRCKSDLKFIECAGNGVAVLASPTVYGQSVQEGKTGLIYHSLQEFEEKLKSLILNPILRYEITDQAYQYVARNRLMAYHYKERYRWYCSLLDRRDELLSNMRRQAPEVFFNWEPNSAPKQ